MEPPQTWLSEPDRLLHIAASCVTFFIFVVAVTRLFGKRTTANMNNFDWIITVGIGSIMSSGILLRNVSMVDAMLAVAVLASCQWLTTWASMRSHSFARLVKPMPRLLMERGDSVPDALRRERIAQEELEAALRAAGMSDHREAAWVVIETNGQLSVISDPSAQGHRDDLIGAVAGSRRPDAWGHTA